MREAQIRADKINFFAKKSQNYQNRRHTQNLTQPVACNEIHVQGKLTGCAFISICHAPLNLQLLHSTYFAIAVKGNKEDCSTWILL
jgi:hypothetical protein